MGDHERTLQIGHADISIKTKHVSTRFEGFLERWDLMKNLFLRTLLGLPPYCDYKPTNAIHSDNPGVHTSEKLVNLSTIDKHHLKCDVIHGFLVNGIREPLPFSFVLNKPTGYRVFCQPETIHFNKIK